jgi:hypothetical protein
MSVKPFSMRSYCDAYLCPLNAMYPLGHQPCDTHLFQLTIMYLHKLQHCLFIDLGKSDKNKFLFTMTAYLMTALDKMCTTLWDSQSQPAVIQPGIEPGSVVTPLALRCSALDHCATWSDSILFPLTQCIEKNVNPVTLIFSH